MSLSSNSSLVSPPVDSSVRENVCFVGYDPRQAIGYLAQLSRWCLDSGIWREQIQVFMPDGSCLLHRGWGKDDSSQQPAGALLKVVCSEPDRKWRLRYRGPTRYTTKQELRSGPLIERRPQLLDLDITFESEYAVWNMQTADGKWGHSHSEQPGKIRGHIEVAERRINIESYGYRNQSRGTRALSAVFDHCWAHGVFPSGRAFAVLCVRMKAEDGPIKLAMSQAVVWDTGRLFPAICKSPPLLSDALLPQPEPPFHFTFDVDSKLGLMHIDAQAVGWIPHSTTRDGEWLDGVVADPSLAYLLTHEIATTLNWNGEQGCGLTEQSQRISGMRHHL